MVVIIINYYLSLSLAIILTRIIMFTIKILPIGSTIIQRLSVIILTLSGCIVISLVSWVFFDVISFEEQPYLSVILVIFCLWFFYLSLVGGFNPSEKYESQWGRNIPYTMENRIHVPNHQPAFFGTAASSKTTALSSFRPCLFRRCGWDALTADRRSSRCSSEPGRTYPGERNRRVYPLVNIQKTMENHHFSWKISL